MAGNNRLMGLTPYDLHKRLINHYVLQRKGATSLLRRDTSRDKRDIDIIRENHRFLWDEDSVPQTWEERLAKKYYDKLFKEYCICDLSRFRENKFAMRWQTEQELITGKGQFVCGSKSCVCKEGLRSWEVNFAYIEHNEKKNALVKLRLCEKCSKKLNYSQKRKEVTRKGKSKKIATSESLSNQAERGSANPGSSEPSETPTNDTQSSDSVQDESNIWKEPINLPEEGSRDDEFQQYLEHLLL